ncbi:MAG TPA: hypothetical protein PK280_12430 [Planctomycetota bacterium]|nr:hypothetical protein [Planctomycetota bacterium]
MSTQTTNLGLTKPSPGHTSWSAAVNQNWDTLDSMAYVSTCISWNLLTGQPDTIGQGTWTRVQSSDRLYCGEFRNPTVDDGDNFTCKFRCPAGTYTLRFHAGKNTDGGIVKVYLDGSQIGASSGYDTYSSPKNVMNVEEITGLAIDAGEHSLQFILDGTNPSSGLYRFRTSGIWLQRTA